MESSLEGRATVWAEDHGWFQRKVQWLGRRGAPDRVFAKDGRTVWVEFKDETTGKVHDLQATEHRRMVRAGMEVHIVDSMAKFCEVMGLPDVEQKDLFRR